MPIQFFSTLAPGGTLTGADNGLTDNAGIIELGGTLIKNTLINNGGRNLQFYSGSSFTVSSMSTEVYFQALNVGVSSAEMTIVPGTVQLAADDAVTNTSNIFLVENNGSIQSNFGNYWQVVRQTTTTANSYVEIGSIGIDASDVNGWTLDATLIRIVLSSDASGGAGIAYNPALLVYDVMPTFWQDNNVWRNLRCSIINGLGSNSAQSIGLQCYLSNPTSNTATLKLRMINPGGLVTNNVGWNVSIYVTRPMKSSFTPTTATGVDTTAYTTPYAMYQANYIGNIYSFFSPVRFVGSTTGYTQISAPASGSSNNVILPGANGTGQLTNDGAGNLSWSAGQSPSVKKATNNAQNASGNITTYAVTVTQMYRVNVTLAITSGTGTFVITCTYIDNSGTSQTATFYSQGTTTSGQVGVGVASFPPVAIFAKSGNNISIDAVLTGTATAQVSTVIETFA